MTLTYQQLLIDLYQAYYSAKKHKSNRSYIKKWEKDLKQNMEDLCNDLFFRTYVPMPSKCFIVEYPKKREIFAAMFRDRIVHHLYFNYTYELFVKTFIQDSYSCIKGRGTHYGVERIKTFCRKESNNWQRKCYVLHLDIRGYFMHINRMKLYHIATSTLRKMSSHRVRKDSTKTWGDVLDMGLVEWLTKIITLLDPKENCIICGSLSDWDGLDKEKSMLHLAEGLGLPIGNLTSQLFSNVYMNIFDQYMKRVLKCRFYGRYVDDAAVVSVDRKWLLSLIPKAKEFLKETLGLTLHNGKIEISEIHRGVEFLGAFILPYRTYISNHSLRRMEKKIEEMDFSKPRRVVRSINSYLGVLGHYASYNIVKRLLFINEILRIGVFNNSLTKFTDRRLYVQHLKSKNDGKGIW